MIVLEPETHIYRNTETGATLTSVTRIIKAVMPTSIDTAPPDKVENARERGIKVEDYITELLKTGGCSLPAGERQDVQERVECFYRWYEEVQPEYLGSQIIVSDLETAAGSIDYYLGVYGKKTIIDLKNTWNAEPEWKVQLGGYSDLAQYAERFGTNGHHACGVLHIHPRFAKGWIWREYDPMIVRSQWNAALQWWKTLQTLKVK